MRDRLFIIGGGFVVVRGYSLKLASSVVRTSSKRVVHDRRVGIWRSISVIASEVTEANNAALGH